MRHHHGFAESSGLSDAISKLAATVGVADTFCQSLGLPQQEAANALLRNCPGVRFLQLSPSQLSTLQQDIAIL